MELTHRFSVPGAVEETWERFGDIASLAECFPGAQVTSFTGDTFEGTVKVKLGPIALVYSGSGRFVSKDEEAHTFVVEAKGRDKRGNGTAGATVTVSMSAGSGSAEGESTDVSVRTDLSITGKPAQFGRGVMQDVSDKLLGQFVACLEQRSTTSDQGGADQGGADQGGADQDAGPASVPTGAAATGAPGEDPDAGPASAPPADQPVGGPARSEAQPAGSAGSAATASAPGTAPGSGTGSASGTASAAGSGTRPAAAGDDALDLGATVLPVLLKGYWKQIAAALGVLVVLRALLRRRG